MTNRREFLRATALDEAGATTELDRGEAVFTPECYGARVIFITVMREAPET